MLPGIASTAFLLSDVSSRPKEMELLALQPPHAGCGTCKALLRSVLRFLQQLVEPDPVSGCDTAFARKAFGSQCQSDIFQLLSSPALRGTFDDLGGLASLET